MTFKKLVAMIAGTKITTWDEFNEICGHISRAFETEKITFNDYEMLYSLVEMAGRAAGLH